jgi:hypothetical protein
MKTGRRIKFKEMAIDLLMIVILATALLLLAIII